MGRDWDLEPRFALRLPGDFGRGIQKGQRELGREGVRWLVPYRQLKQDLFRSGSVLGLLARDGAPRSPELDRIWIVSDGAFKNVNRALEDSPPDHIPGNLSIPASMKKSLDESDRQLPSELHVRISNLTIRSNDKNGAEDGVYGGEVISEFIEGSGEI